MFWVTLKMHLMEILICSVDFFLLIVFILQLNRKLMEFGYEF